MIRNTACVLALVAITASGCGGKRDKGLQNKGSDTLVNVALAWAEAYKKVNPELRVSVSGGGSGVGIAQLINGKVDLANSSRKMKSNEIELAKSKGITPIEHVVGWDALAVYLHKDNPKTKYTIAELAEIYGEGGKFSQWSDLGIEVPGCSSSEIVRISRQNNSGTYAYFKKTVLGPEREYKLGSRDLHGSKDVVETVEKTACAIGYSGLAYATDHVQLASIAKDENSPYVAPTVASAVDGSYPISRPLLMYTNGEPQGRVKEYLDWILSDEGQRILQDKGYAPVRKIDAD